MQSCTADYGKLYGRLREFEPTESPQLPQRADSCHITVSCSCRFCFGELVFRKGMAGSTCQDLPFPPNVGGSGASTLLPPGCLPSYRQLCLDCWEDDPRQRPSAEQVLERLTRCASEAAAQLQQRQQLALPAAPEPSAGDAGAAGTHQAGHPSNAGRSRQQLARIRRSLDYHELLGSGMQRGLLPGGAAAAMTDDVSRSLSSVCNHSTYDAVVDLPLGERVRLISREGIPRYEQGARG